VKNRVARGKRGTGGGDGPQKGRGAVADRGTKAGIFLERGESSLKKTMNGSLSGLTHGETASGRGENWGVRARRIDARRKGLGERARSISERKETSVMALRWKKKMTLITKPGGRGREGRLRRLGPEKTEPAWGVFNSAISGGGALRGGVGIEISPLYGRKKAGIRTPTKKGKTGPYTCSGKETRRSSMSVGKEKAETVESY